MAFPVDFPQKLRVTQISDELPTPSFFIRFRDPVNALTPNWNYARSHDIDLAERITSDANILVTQRAFSANSQALTRKAKAAGTPVIYETDDLLLDLPPQSGFRLNTGQVAAIKEMIASADLVTCSTSALAVRLSEYNARVSVLENYAIPFESVRVRSARSGAPHAAIVNTDYFKLIAAKNELFRALEHAITDLNYSISFLGSVDPSMVKLKELAPDRVHIIPSFVPWRRRFLERLMELRVNVAIVPLEDNVHHSFKSDVKFLDFASIGVAGIFNNRRIYKRVRHQSNGFLCDDTYEGWVAGLEYLADAQIRDRMGEGAYETASHRVMEHYAGELTDCVLGLVSEDRKHSRSKVCAHAASQSL